MEGFARLGGHLTVLVHGDVPGYLVCNGVGTATSPIKQFAFDLWLFKSSAHDSHMEEEERGPYLKPDTRYTDERKDILATLAEASSSNKQYSLYRTIL